MLLSTISRRLALLRSASYRPDLTLLVFLMLLVNVKLGVKLVAVAGILLVLPRQEFSLRRLPLFYPLVIALASLNFLFNSGFLHRNQSLAFAMGIGFWLLCLLACRAVKQFSEQLNSETIDRTLRAFFLLNALAALGQYGAIVWETGALNPYRYQGDYQKYFINTGDFIQGLAFDSSGTNAALCALGVLYFLARRNAFFLLLCMGVLLATGSNLTIGLCGGLLLLLFLLRSDRVQKSFILACWLLTIVFFARVSPQNNQYVTGMLAYFSGKEPGPAAGQKHAAPTDDPRKRQAQAYLDSLSAAAQGPVKAPVAADLRLPEDDIHSAAFQHRNDTNGVRKVLIAYREENTTPAPQRSRYADDKRPGKWIALEQTLTFLHQHPVRLFTGLGMGNYSSKLALRTTAIGVAGGYPERFRWVHPAFERDHLDLYLYYFSEDASRHSVLNGPHSVYDQMLSEYGLAGLLALLLFYFGYFARRWRLLSYGLPLLLLLGGLLATDYWFEQLSLLPFAELLLFLDLRKKEVPA